MTALPLDYAVRVCAVVLDKMIGVYLGRPLIVSDDDLSGIFALVLTTEEHGLNLGAR